MDATTVAIDLARDILEVALANRAGRIIEGKRLTRRQFERFVAELPTGTEVIMEAGGTAHDWAGDARRVISTSGCCPRRTCGRMSAGIRPIGQTPTRCSKRHGVVG